jgi:hypothetical protein
MYAVETNIPIPAPRKPDTRYPFKELEVGYSFLVHDGNIRSVRSRCSQVKLATGHKFTVRKVQGGVRVWRIA